jgi:hypothetical protein
MPLRLALFLGLGILVTALLFSGGTDPLKGYVPPQTSAYYAENLPELKNELEQNVLPRLEGAAGCEISGTR